MTESTPAEDPLAGDLPDREHDVLEVLNAAHAAYDLGTLLFPVDMAGHIAAAYRVTAERLRFRGAWLLRHHKKGAVGINKALVLAAQELDLYADALDGLAGTPSATPVQRTEASAAVLRATADDFTPTSPFDDRVIQFSNEVAPPCGLTYLGQGFDPCILPVHGPESSHQGEHSKWPWQDGVSAPGGRRETIVNYLKGNTDELGTEPLPGMWEQADLTGGQTDNPPRSTSLEPGEYIAAGIKSIDSGRAQITEISLNAEPSIFPGAGIVSVDGLIREPSYPGPPPGKNPLPARVTAWPGGEITITPYTSQEVPANMEAAMQPQPDPFSDPVHVKPPSGWHTPVPANPAPWTAQRHPDVPPIHQSSIKTGEACGLQLRLTDCDRVPQIPTWANVGGSGVHYAIQYIEQQFVKNGVIEGQDAAIANAMFQTGLDHAIADADQESGSMPRKLWRVSGKGQETETWWRENGPEMVRSYAAWSAQRHADGWSIAAVCAGQPGNPEWVPAIEVPFNFDHKGVQLEGTIDQIWIRQLTDGSWEVELIDPKSAGDVTEDPLQLAFYARALPHLLPDDVHIASVRAAYYDARNGKLKDFIDPLAAVSDEEIFYRASQIERMYVSGVYPANPGTGFKFGSPCVICPVSYACPIMALKRPGLES